MPSFPVSIAFLSLVQAALVALPRAVPPARLAALESRWWALVPAASIIGVIALVGAYGESAQGLTYLALFAVPPLAAVALAGLIRGARPLLALAAAPLFACAWWLSGSLAGETAALALSALACVTLGWLLVCVVPAGWLRLGVYAMALADTYLVVTDLLQGPNAVLSAAAPGIDLPSLQTVSFGSASMGFGDLFVAATVGALVASLGRRSQLRVAMLAAILALGFDLLFFAVDELPATVPIALALALFDLRTSTRAAGAPAKA